MSGISRRDFLKRSGLLVAVVSAGPIVAACQPGAERAATLERAREQGFIRVGFANEAPYGFADASGNLTGEAPEVAREVMSRLGVPELDGVLTTFGSLIPGLQAGRFDLIAAGMFITPERCQQILFSDPDYCVEQAFLVEQGNPFGIQRYEDIAADPDIELGVLTGAVELGQAQDSGVPDGQINRFDSPADLLEALRGGRIDAVALTTISVNNLAQTADFAGVEVTEGFAYGGELGCGGYGFRPEDQEFRDEFNAVLNEMKNAGEIRPVVEEFGFADAVEAAVGVTAEELCEA